MSNIAFLGSKLLQEAIYPFNWAVLFLLISFGCLLRRRYRPAAWLQAAGLLFLLVPASGFVVEALSRPLEATYPVRRAEDCPAAELIVVLGGSTAPLHEPRLEAEEVSGARLQMAARLYRAGKGKAVVVSGGQYKLGPERFRAEAEDMRDVLEGMGVPRSAIIMEPNSRNTFENAAFTAKLLKERSADGVLLVTSALHLPRAAALFEKQGVKVTPAPCSFVSGCNHGMVSGLKPAAVNIVHTESAIKEYVGRFAYWLFGKA